MTNAEALDYIKQHAEVLVNFAKANGVVLTVTQEPLKPLAMGHYETVIDVRAARVRNI